MGMFAQSPSQLLMLLIPVVMTIVVVALRKPPRRIWSSGIIAAIVAAAIYIFALSLTEGFGPLFLIGYADTMLLYLPICLVMSALLVLGLKALRMRNPSARP